MASEELDNKGGIKVSQAKENSNQVLVNKSMKENEMSEEKEAPKKLSRKDFVKGAAAVAGVGALASCAPAATPAPGETAAPAPTCPPAAECPPCAVPGVPETWDKEADVVVVGSGTGLTGALAAAAAGAKVIVLEKRDVAGGSTGICGGACWIPNNSVMKAKGIQDSRENALTYMRLIAQGQADDELIVAFVDKGPEMLDFVAANSPMVWGEFEWTSGRAKSLCTEYHPDWPGSIDPPRCRGLAPYEDGKQQRGAGFIRALLAGCEAEGVELLLETPAKRLIARMLPDGRQEVLGVVAESGGETINIKANKGVLLAAGGYEWNDEMKKRFLRGPARYALAAPGNEGDGILMAMAVGCDLANMNETWHMPFYVEPSEANYEAQIMSTPCARSLPGAILANRYGERFCNEASDYDSIWRSFLAWENWGDLRYRNLPAYSIMDEKYRTTYGIGGKAGDPVPDWVKQANTLRELAAALGIDPDGLEKTVSEFNENAREGKDPQFHRGESIHDRGFTGDAAIEGPGATLAPLETPPFYGAEVSTGDIGTCGGPRVNANAQVLTPFGSVIPRLYCSGNNSGVGGPGASYGGTGGTVGPGMTFAYIAGQDVVTLEPWE